MSSSDTVLDQDITGANTFTEWFKLRGFGITPFTVKMGGTWAGTLTFQMRKPDDATDIISLDTFTANDFKNGDASGSWDIRVGFKTGEFTSGTAEIKIST